MYPKDVDRMANSVDPDQEPSELSLHCLPNIKSEMRSFKSNENIHKKEGGSYYVWHKKDIHKKEGGSFRAKPVCEN